MVYMTQGKTFYSFTRDSWQSVFTWSYLCHKRSYQIQNELYYSCRCLWFMCQLEFAARYQNYCLNGKPYRTAPKKNGALFTLHGWNMAAGWQGYLSAGYLITRKGILKCEKREGNGNCTGRFTSSDDALEKNVPRTEMMKIGVVLFNVITAKKNGWRRASLRGFCSLLENIFGLTFYLSFLFFPFSPPLLLQEFRGASQQSGSQLYVFLYDQRDTSKCFSKSFHFNRQKGFIEKKKLICL